MKVQYPKLYNMTHLLALNVLLLPKDLTIIFIYEFLWEGPAKIKQSVVVQEYCEGGLK